MTDLFFSSAPSQDPTVLSGTLRSTLDPHGEYEDAAIFDALRRVHLLPAEGAKTPTPAPSAAGADEDEVNANVFEDLDSKVSESGENFSQVREPQPYSRSTNRQLTPPLLRTTGREAAHLLRARLAEAQQDPAHGRGDGEHRRPQRHARPADAPRLLGVDHHHHHDCAPAADHHRVRVFVVVPRLARRCRRPSPTQLRPSRSLPASTRSSSCTRASVVRTPSPGRCSRTRLLPSTPSARRPGRPSLPSSRGWPRRRTARGSSRPPEGCRTGNIDALIHLFIETILLPQAIERQREAYWRGEGRCAAQPAGRTHGRGRKREVRGARVDAAANGLPTLTPIPSAPQLDLSYPDRRRQSLRDLPTYSACPPPHRSRSSRYTRRPKPGPRPSLRPRPPPPLGPPRPRQPLRRRQPSRGRT